jgi:hypothetical protein
MGDQRGRRLANVLKPRPTEVSLAAPGCSRGPRRVCASATDGARILVHALRLPRALDERVPIRQIWTRRHRSECLSTMRA